MKAHQRIIRERQAEIEASENLFGAYWNKLDLRLENGIIKRTDYETAASVILKYEWLGTMANTKEHYGIFFDGFCGGVCCYGQADGWTARTVVKYGIPENRIWVLSRGACVHWAHPHSGSKLISQSLKMLKKEVNPLIVIAYSDYEAGEIGTLYQATNWIYLGICKRNAEGFISPAGEKLHRNIIYDMRRRQGTRKEKTWSDMKNELLDCGWKTYTIPDKARYVYPLDKKVRGQIEKEAKPYPKRADYQERIVGNQSDSLGQFQESAPD